jgi:hypothetical protein
VNFMKDWAHRRKENFPVGSGQRPMGQRDVRCAAVFA